MPIDDSQLGSPGCPEGARKYLNVIFICGKSRILFSEGKLTALILVSEDVFSDNALTGQLASEESSYEFPAGRASPSDGHSGVVPTTLSTQNDGKWIFAWAAPMMSLDSFPASADFGAAHHPRSFIPTISNNGNNLGAPTSTNTNRSIAEAGPLEGVIDAQSRFSTPAPTSSLCLPESVPNAVIQVQNWLSTYEYIHSTSSLFFRGLNRSYHHVHSRKPRKVLSLLRSFGQYRNHCLTSILHCAAMLATSRSIEGRR